MDRTRLGLWAGLVVTGAIVAGQIVAPERVPLPVAIGAALVLAVVLWFVVIRYLLSVAYRVWRRVYARLYWALTLVLPESPLVKFAAGSMVLIFMVIVIIGGLPMVVGNLSEADEGAASYVNEIGAEALNTQWDDIINGDAVAGEPACDGTVAGAEAGATDRDGDGLPDAWERAGETPRGAPLPGADPGRKDLYVQVNYGTNVPPLTATERQQLRESWATMPVANPDGSTGVTLHLDNDSTGAGTLDDAAAIDALADRNAYYTEDRLGPRRCVYRQVVYGQVDVDGVAGVASTPGYSAVVDGARQSNYAGGVSFRVALTNHELLHTAVGRVDGRSHTSEGWLAGGPDNEYLSGAAAADANATGIHGPAS